MTFTPPTGPRPEHRHPHSGPPGTSAPNLYGHHIPPYRGYGYPPGPQQFAPPPPKKNRTGLIVIGIVLLLVVGVGVFFGIRALVGDADTASSDTDVTGAGEGSGDVFSPPNKPYSVEIPKGVVKVPPEEDESIPSETDLSLELEGKAQSGGLIKTGTLAGQAAKGTYAEVGEEAAQGYAGQYEGHPDQWGAGAKVDKATIKVGGRDAIEITARFSPNGEADPSIFFQVYFIDPPSGTPILITCDWNTTDTEDIKDACDTLVASFKVTD